MNETKRRENEAVMRHGMDLVKLGLVQRRSELAVMMRRFRKTFYKEAEKRG